MDPATNPQPDGDPEARTCGICQGLRIVRIVHDPSNGTRRHVRFCPKCDHITRRK